MLRNRWRNKERKMRDIEVTFFSIFNFKIIMNVASKIGFVVGYSSNFSDKEIIMFARIKNLKSKVSINF